jgi:hypothetical protein
MPNDSLTAWGPIDIHAHFYPQAYLDVLAQEGPRFNVEYWAGGGRILHKDGSALSEAASLPVGRPGEANCGYGCAGHCRTGNVAYRT